MTDIIEVLLLDEPYETYYAPSLELCEEDYYEPMTEERSEDCNTDELDDLPF